MQDISRDDFAILNASDADTYSTDKNMCPTLISQHQNVCASNDTSTRPLIKDSNEAPSFACVKLGDVNDLFPTTTSSWQQYQAHDLDNERSFLGCSDSFDHNSPVNLLLQGSHDPLISHGAASVLSNDDEHPTDFARNLITPNNQFFPNTEHERADTAGITRISNQQRTSPRPVKSGCSSLTKQQLKVKANLMSAQNQLQQQSERNTSLLTFCTKSTGGSLRNQKNQKAKNKKGNTIKLRFHHQALPAEYLSHYEATQGQQRSCKNQQFSTKTPSNSQKPAAPRSSHAHENVRSWVQKIAEIQKAANATKEYAANMKQNLANETQCQPSHTNKSHDFQDTLSRLSTDANSNFKMQQELETPQRRSSSHSLPTIHSRTNCMRSHYSDLPYMGEITLDNCKPRRGRKPKKADICHLIYKNYGTSTLPKASFSSNYSSQNFTGGDCFKNELCEQPLNLCLRDQLPDTYSVSSGDELSETYSTCPTPVSTALDTIRDSMLAHTLKKSLHNINDHRQDEGVEGVQNTSVAETKAVHPIAMCYKTLLESGVLPQSTNGRFETIKKDNQLALKIPIPNGFFQPHKLVKCVSSPQNLNQDYVELLSVPPSTTQAETTSTQLQQPIMAQKRKRSAIFIPPMSTENSNNPATEVSICKFKFTGGSKPSLQEKKMISVDAGGNYCYFSGTGDKSTRGYEYFPRESLQQTAGLLPGVNCIGQKLYTDVTSAPAQSLSHDLLQNLQSYQQHADKSVTDSMDSFSPNTSSTPLAVSNNETCFSPIKETFYAYSSSAATPTTTTAKTAASIATPTATTLIENHCSA